ncbi:hypothetical protein C8J56DRAFT_890793 [Mycena floridula]|nr:hypothetical protein C8J56DRAFT_890793 [Mycena floridula]
MTSQPDEHVDDNDDDNDDDDDEADDMDNQETENINPKGKYARTNAKLTNGAKKRKRSSGLVEKFKDCGHWFARAANPFLSVEQVLTVGCQLDGLKGVTEDDELDEDEELCTFIRLFRIYRGADNTIHQNRGRAAGTRAPNQGLPGNAISDQNIEVVRFKERFT